MVKISKFYGAPWCSDCKRTKQFLGEHRISYEDAWIDIEADEAAALEVEKINDGKRRIPTLVFDDGSILVVPDNATLAQKLDLVQNLSHDFHDVVIVGGGPTGLTATLYLARDDVDVAILEKGALGGQVGFTQRLDNYPGFPEGISGEELAERIIQQVKNYADEILTATDVTSIEAKNGILEVNTSDGRCLGSKTVVIATGSKYRTLNVPGESDLIGYKIHFCATCDFIWYKGQEVIVVGGGNSAFEESLFLAKHLKKVTILVRSTAKASKVLQDKVAETPNIEVKLSTIVEEFKVGPKKTLEGVVVKNTSTGETEILHPNGVFLFVGLTPNAEMVKDLVELDRQGFIITDSSMMTKTKGVFAAGDVRAGSTKQAVAAMGEGAAVAIHLREYLKSL